MEMRRTIHERVFRAINPCPPTKRSEVAARAGIDFLDIRDTFCPFRIVWPYQADTVVLDGGQEIALRESEAAHFRQRWEKHGMILVAQDATEEEERQARINGLRRAIAFWKARGRRKVLDLRKIHGVTAEQEDEYKGDWWVYYFNEELAKVCEEEFRRLQVKPQPEPKPKKSNTKE